jgi:hypothetical protein
MGPLCARKCFTNSTPLGRFFQNFRWPSAEPVSSMSQAAATATCVTVSRCMKLRSYMLAAGTPSKYAASCSSTYNASATRFATCVRIGMLHCSCTFSMLQG